MFLKRAPAVIAKNNSPIEDQMHLDSEARGGSLTLHRRNDLSLSVFYRNLARPQ